MGRRRRVCSRELGGLLLSREALIARGVSTRRLASGEFARVFSSCYTPVAEPATVLRMCGVLQHDVLPGSCLSHSTAAALLGIALPASLDGGVTFHLPRASSLGEDTGIHRSPPSSLDVHLHCRDLPSRHRSATSRVTVHRMSPGLRVQSGDLVVSHPIDVLCELSGQLGHADLVAAVDSVLGPNFPIRGICAEAIRAHIGTRTPFRHSAKLLTALADARAGVESPGETFMRLIVVAAGFPEPEPNVPQFDPIARTTRRIDGGYRAQLVGMEYDGDVHRTKLGQWRKDEARRDGLAAAGWVLRRMTGRDLSAPDDFLARLHRVCVERGVPAPEQGSWRRRALLVGAADHTPEAVRGW